MKKFFNKRKRKLHYLNERIRLSESNYLTMKVKSQMYDAMMSNITYSSEVEHEDIKDIHGNVITRIYKGKTAAIDVDIVEMLANGGITFDKTAVKLNVTGI